MDKLSQYRQYITKLLSEYEALANSSPPDDSTTHALFDEPRDRYMVFETGWWGKKRIRSATLYLHLYNGKIYIEEDWTEDGIATDLLRLGVPREDIVLAFQPPQMRPYTEFAVA